MSLVSQHRFPIRKPAAINKYNHYIGSNNSIRFKKVYHQITGEFIIKLNQCFEIWMREEVIWKYREFSLRHENVPTDACVSLLSLFYLL